MTMPLADRSLLRLEPVRPASVAAGSDAIVLGMPHLCLGGLSETWLLKELGDRHWGLLAGAAGRSRPEFRDGDGEPIYAAFTAVSLRDGAFGRAREHDRLTLSSRLNRLSRTQFASSHRLAIEGRPLGAVELVSVFVKRQQKGRNRSIARIAVDGLPPVGGGCPSGDWPATAAALRGGLWSEHFGFARESGREQGRLIVDPCPSQDFNGADFLYFAAFQGFVDRAEWALLPRGSRYPVTRCRDIVYRGNIEPGDRVAIVLLGSRQTADGFAHWCRLERDGDGAPLAEVFTMRAV